MARRAQVIGSALDIDGQEWDVRETRSTPHGFDIQIGWPAGAARGRGGRGVAVILTRELADHLTAHRTAPGRLDLPIGRSTIKRLRRALGLDWYVDRRDWWEDRLDDLIRLTGAEFATRHGVSEAAVATVRIRILGHSLRSKEWWLEPSSMHLLTSSFSTIEVAETLGIAISTARRVRALARDRLRAGGRMPWFPELRAIRLSRGLSLQALADRLEMKISFLSMLETGGYPSTPSNSVAARLAAALGVETDALGWVPGAPQVTLSRLRQIRHGLGLTAAELETISGVRFAKILRLELGQKAYIDDAAVIRLAAALSVAPEDLLGEPTS
jgi:transcriptional regulator with XRE-family HTH domain